MVMGHSGGQMVQLTRYEHLYINYICYKCVYIVGDMYALYSQPSAKCSLNPFVFTRVSLDEVVFLAKDHIHGKMEGK